ncbi:MAG: hypothetical protein GY820_30500 [Gammaproteobacteria bacterium]|nr:hypothetical protein [Gammaproteobacteria bacterium]
MELQLRGRESRELPFVFEPAGVPAMGEVMLCCKYGRINVRPFNIYLLYLIDEALTGWPNHLTNIEVERMRHNSHA